MTLRLLLLRHAKSDWSDPAAGDRNRPLSERGRADAGRMGAWIAAHDLAPRAILSSPALRARRTTEHVRAALEAPPAPLWLEELYTFRNADALARAIRAHGGMASPLLLTGHNNAIHELALELAAEGEGEGAPGPLRRLAKKYPTAALAVFALPIGAWKDFRPAGARLLHFVRPRDIRTRDIRPGESR